MIYEIPVQLFMDIITIREEFGEWKDLTKPRSI